MKYFILLLSVVAILATGSAYGSWSGTIADQIITYNSTPDDSFKVQTASFAVGLAGELYAIYSMIEYPGPSYPRELYFSKSIDGGYTWSGTSGNFRINASDGQSVYQSANKKYTDILIDSDGRIFVVWCEDYGTTGIREIMLVYSTDGGGTWQNSTADFPISYTAGAAYDAGNPSLAIDPDDNLHAVWHQKTTAVSGNYEVLYSKSTDHGLSWSGQQQDSIISFPDSWSAWDPDIECDTSGHIFVVWREQSISLSDSLQLLFGKSTDGGVSFSSQTADIPISLNYKETADAVIHIDALNNIHVVYHGSNSVPLIKLCLYTGSSNGGVTWSGLDALRFIDLGPDSTINSWNPDITSTSNGVLCAVFDADNPASGLYRTDIWASYSYDNGLTWTGNTSPDLVSLPDVVNTPKVPYIVTGPGDTLHVIWRERPTLADLDDLYYSRGDTLATGDTTGWISGTVTDQAYLPIEGVFVEALGTAISDSTDENGIYILSDLITDIYNVRFSHDNYFDTTVTNITVTPGDTIILDVMMAQAGYQYLPADMGMYYPVWPPAVQGGDVTYYVNFMRQYVTSIPCYFDGPLGSFWASADVNGSCGVDGADLSTLVSVMRNILDPMYCDQYPTLWPTPLDLPPTEPAGWPNCDNTPVTDVKVVPTNPVR